MNLIKRLSFALSATICLISASFSVNAAIPDGYYDACEGKSGQDLLKALYSTISSHTNVGYDGLWNVYKKSDVRADGTLWDMYSTKAWPSNFTKCGNYSVVGDCVNREHSLPKSWWGGGKSAQYSDAFHLYPTDGKVNGQRSNYPFGECANGTYLANNGNVRPLGRLGTSTFSGYSGKVFEPDDQYKGDFARSYFYMAACYNNLIQSWSSDMLAGNSYPVFKTWAVNLLMKWTRQDEVSQKELDRNEAVYSFQKNRNPFIDHPEMAEHIWGTKQSTPWYSNSTPTPSLSQPVAGATVNLGVSAPGFARTATVAVKGANLTQNLTVTCSGSGFSVSPATISAAAANSGTSVTITYSGSTIGSITGSLKVSSSEVSATNSLKIKVESGLPVNDPTEITPHSFNISWVYLGDADEYSLHLMQGSQYVAGYPMPLTADEEGVKVEDLDPETTYTVWITSPTLESRHITVTTAPLIPSVTLYFDGKLDFLAAPGEPSDVAELLMEAENIATDITVSVAAPFQVSTDKSSWARSVTLAPEEDRFYLRLLSQAEGTFATDITISAGDYLYDDAQATGSVVDPNAVSFFEDWEEVVNPTTSVNCYSNTSFQGTACSWIVSNGGFGTGTQDKNFNNSVTMRMGKNTNSSIAMNEDKTAGLGIVTFDAALWPNDADATINVEYSTDGGNSWTLAKTITLNSETSSTFSVDINVAGNGRIRFRQSAGSRWFIDNIGITNYTDFSSINDLEYHSWDAYCCNGELVIENHLDGNRIAVYGIDGITWSDKAYTAGQHSIALPKGLYIVVCNDFSRRVLVK